MKIYEREYKIAVGHTRAALNLGAGFKKISGVSFKHCIKALGEIFLPANKLEEIIPAAMQLSQERKRHIYIYAGKLYRQNGYWLSQYYK